MKFSDRIAGLIKKHKAYDKAAFLPNISDEAWAKMHPNHQAILMGHVVALLSS